MCGREATTKTRQAQPACCYSEQREYGRKIHSCMVYHKQNLNGGELAQASASRRRCYLKNCKVNWILVFLFFSMDCNEIVRSGCYTELTK